VEDHAVLLASLLLGFGLDAYVGVGMMADGSGVETEAAWVVTRYSTAAPAAPSGRRDWVQFWDPLSGQRVVPGEALADGSRHARIACLFNNEAFYANHAVDDSAATTRWDLDELSQWKPMDTGLLAALPRPPPVPLAPASLPAAALSGHVEQALKAGITALRQGHADALTSAARDRLAAAAPLQPAELAFLGAGEAAPPAWDAALEYRLHMALASYEVVRRPTRCVF